MPLKCMMRYGAEWITDRTYGTKKSTYYIIIIELTVLWDTTNQDELVNQEKREMYTIDGKEVFHQPMANWSTVRSKGYGVSRVSRVRQEIQLRKTVLIKFRLGIIKDTLGIIR